MDTVVAQPVVKVDLGCQSIKVHAQNDSRAEQPKSRRASFTSILLGAAHKKHRKCAVDDNDVPDNKVEDLETLHSV